MIVDAPLVFTRFFHFASCMTLFGASAFCFAAPKAVDAIQPMRTCLRILLRTAAVIALVSNLLWFLCAAASMTGQWASILNWTDLRTVLLATQFGQVCQWRTL